MAISTFNKSNDDDFFGDAVDTPKQGTEQHKKREYLKGAIDKDNEHLLGSKWTRERIDKASDGTINKKYVEYKQRELNEKGEKTGKVLDKHVIDLYSADISPFVKIRDDRTLKMIQSLKIKWLAWAVFSCVRLVIILRLY